MGSFLPLSIDLSNKNVLVVGAGTIAYKKIVKLLQYKAKVKVVTKSISCSSINTLKDQCIVEERAFESRDLDNVFLVIAATDDADFNKEIFQLCNQRNILINNITSKEEMNCRFVAVYEDEQYQIGISAYGYPKKSVWLKKKISEFLNSLK